METDNTSKAVRFEAGKRLTSEQKKEVLKGLQDAYKVNMRPYTIETLVNAYGRDYEKKVWLENAADYMVQSDITGRLLRWYIYMPDGKIAHPTELYPNITPTEAKRVQDNLEYYQAQADRKYTQVFAALKEYGQIERVIEILKGVIEYGATFFAQFDSSDIGKRDPLTLLRWRGNEGGANDPYMHVRTVPEQVAFIMEEPYLQYKHSDYLDYKQEKVRNKWFNHLATIDWERFYKEFSAPAGTTEEKPTN